MKALTRLGQRRYSPAGGYSAEQARELASWGVTGIFTDRPQDFPAEALAR